MAAISLGLNQLSLLVQGPDYSGKPRSSSHWLISWMATSPPHEMEWYGLCHDIMYANYVGN